MSSTQTKQYFTKIDKSFAVATVLLTESGSSTYKIAKSAGKLLGTHLKDDPIKEILNEFRDECLVSPSKKRADNSLYDVTTWRVLDANELRSHAKALATNPLAKKWQALEIPEIRKAVGLED